MRTDLAVESEAVSRGCGVEGIEKNTAEDAASGFELTEIIIKSGDAARAVGRPCGRYLTARCISGRLCDSVELAAARSELLSRRIRALAGKPGRTLIVGLGNTEITPDSLGPRTAAQVLATRHIKRLARDLDTTCLGETAVIAPGVMAQTGMESQTVVRSLIRELSPDLVIAVDALACAEPLHLGSTVQLCDTGISPGSGVENARAELSERTLGVRTIAIGVPTVTDCAVIAEQCGGTADGALSGMFVSPRDIDALVIRTSAMIAEAVNLALHPSLSREELRLLF